MVAGQQAGGVRLHLAELFRLAARLACLDAGLATERTRRFLDG